MKTKDIRTSSKFLDACLKSRNPHQIYVLEHIKDINFTLVHRPHLNFARKLTNNIEALSAQKSNVDVTNNAPMHSGLVLTGTPAIIHISATNRATENLFTKIWASTPSAFHWSTQI